METAASADPNDSSRVERTLHPTTSNANRDRDGDVVESGGEPPLNNLSRLNAKIGIFPRKTRSVEDRPGSCWHRLNITCW